MAVNSDDGTITLYCHNDGCTVRSERYEGEFPPTHCAECGSRLHNRPVVRETIIRGPRSYDTF